MNYFSSSNPLTDEQTHLLQEIEKLPDKMQQACYWLIKNLELVNQLTANPVDEQWLDEQINKAKNRNDDLLLLLLLYQKSRNISQ